MLCGSNRQQQVSRKSSQFPTISTDRLMDFITTTTNTTNNLMYTVTTSER